MNFNDRFIDSGLFEGLYRSAYRCMTCGAVIEDTRRHEEWHQKLEAQRPEPPKDFDFNVEK